MCMAAASTSAVKRRVISGVARAAPLCPEFDMENGRQRRGAAGASASAGATASLGAAGTAIGETLGSLGSYTIAVGTYTITAPVALIAGIGVAIAAMASYAVTRRLRASGASETQSLLRGTSYGTTRDGDNMV